MKDESLTVGELKEKLEDVDDDAIVMTTVDRDELKAKHVVLDDKPANINDRIHFRYHDRIYEWEEEL